MKHIKFLLVATCVLFFSSKTMATVVIEHGAGGSVHNTGTSCSWTCQTSADICYTYDSNGGCLDIYVSGLPQSQGCNWITPYETFQVPISEGVDITGWNTNKNP